MNTKSGALDAQECPRYASGRCKCGSCEFCNNQKHTGIHCSIMGESPTGGKPFGHEFKPRKKT